jgi:hypothetical protein
VKISYIISHGVGEWVDFDTASDGTLTVRLTPRCDGVLLLGGALHRVKGGETTIPLASIPDGEHLPRLECDEGVITLASFTKRGRCIAPTQDSKELARRLLHRTHELEQRLKTAEKDLAELKRICRGHKIFNYSNHERKDK